MGLVVLMSEAANRWRQQQQEDVQSAYPQQEPRRGGSFHNCFFLLSTETNRAKRLWKSQEIF
jgi:hypothetical protein